MATAIITGGSRGLGRALTRALVELGWNVVIDGRDGAALDEVRRSLPAPRVRALPGDVTDPAHRRALVGAATAFGTLDLVVNNASTIGPSPLLPLAAYPLEELRTVYETNVFAPLALVQLALPQLEAAHGRVINISSDAAVEPYDTWGGYGSSKAALDQLSAILAAEHPTLEVYAVDPGDMRTDLHQAAFPGQDISDRPTPEASVPGLLALVLGEYPSGRYAARQIVEVPA